MTAPLWKQEKAEADLEPLLRRVRAVSPGLLEEFPRNLNEILAAALPSLMVRRKDNLVGADVKAVLQKELDIKCEFIKDDQQLSGLTFATDQFVAIFIDTQFGEEAARFTLAHEGGHLATEYIPHLEKGALAGARVLRADPLENLAATESKKSPRREVVANACAAGLLAPIKAVQDVTAAGPLDLVETVRLRFGLSHQAATIRLMELGLIPQARLAGQAPR
jgi:Zn-dependent peptidase ImmA (M78 family)